MPIATCFVRDEVARQPDVDGLTALWSEESGVGDEEMTINVVSGAQQAGSAYSVMALLYLPSLWSAEQIDRLQLGLARALSRGFAVALADVHVITSVVKSGRVVERGEIQEW